MITRGTEAPKSDVWALLAEPLPDGVISWRQDGRPVARDGKYFARFVAYIEANTVRERLDATVPGEWDLTLELLPPMPQAEPDADTAIAFKARLQILGVIREDVGHGKDYKQAATDAFKRSAVRFGIAHELYSYEQNWVQVDGDGKYAKPVEDPTEAYARRMARNGNAGSAPARPTRASDATSHAATTGGADSPTMNSTATSNGSTTRSEPSVSSQSSPDEPLCPKCGSRLWDNRLSKRNPKAPDGKCRSRTCDGVLWKWGEANRAGRTANADEQEPPPDDDFDPSVGF